MPAPSSEDKKPKVAVRARPAGNGAEFAPQTHLDGFEKVFPSTEHTVRNSKAVNY